MTRRAARHLLSLLFLLGFVSACGAALGQEKASVVEPLGQQPAEPISDAFPLDQVERGQKGYGLSVFEGSQVDRFEVEVVGVLRDLSPGVSYILGRLSGRGLEGTGVVAGMSGSPVFIDERLAGAVAFSWGFTNEAIAGITPIDEMRTLSGLPPGKSFSWARETDPEGAAGTRGSLVPRGTGEPSLRRLLAERPGIELLEAELQRLLPRLSEGAQPTVQYTMAGYGEAARSLLERAVGPVAQAGRAADLGADLRPGSSVAGVLVDGDLQITVSGTVTDRSGDEVLALGHPFLGIGPANLPMAPAEVVTVVSSQANSFKLTNVGEPVGAFDQDRSAGLRGKIGRRAETVPLRIHVAGPAAEERSFAMQLADLPVMAPSLVAISVIEALQAASYVGGVSSVELRCRLELRGHEPLELRQVFDGSAAGVDGALYLLLITGYLIHNPFESVSVRSIDVELVQSGEPRAATLLSAHADSTEVRPGESVRLVLELQAYRGERYREEVEISIPASQPPGPYYLFVGDGQSIDATRLQLEPLAEQNLEQALRLLRSFRARDRIGVIAAVPARGLAVDGQALPQLPGSIRSLWDSSPSFGTKKLNLAMVQDRTLAAQRPFDGVRRLDLKILEHKR